MTALRETSATSRATVVSRPTASDPNVRASRPGIDAASDHALDAVVSAALLQRACCSMCNEDEPCQDHQRRIAKVRPGAVLALQRTIGNRNLERILGARSAALSRIPKTSSATTDATPSPLQRQERHELTHVAQQTHARTPLLQRQPKPNTELWLTQVDDILPRKVGLLFHIHRIGQLTDRFTTNQLNELIGLIHANPDATTFTRDQAGVPGIFALQDTRIGNRLDVAAARFLLKRFPARPSTPRKSDVKEAEVFSEEVVRDAYIRFHYNAILPGKDDPVPADLPNEIRQNCIAIVHALAPQLFTSESVVKKIEQRFKKLRKKGETYTMVHTGEALAGIGVANPRVEIKFKDAAGKTTNGDTEPTTLTSSPWDKVMDKVGNDYGWHIFGMAIMDGHHSVTLFVDNQPERKALYWADQWRIDPGDDFFELPGSISGFRQYEKAGFDKFIETKTNEWWNDVHRPDSKCGKAKGNKWDSGCRYSATLMLWQLRKVVHP
jgi:hypothetical protein